MSWISWRSNIIVLTVVTALFLLGIGNSIGVPLNSTIIGIPVTWLLAGLQGIILFAFWKKYI